MATIEPYDTNTGRRYRVRYRKPDGKQTDKRGFKTKRDATMFLNQVEVSKLEGSYVDPSKSKALISDLGAEWLKRQSHLSPTTLRAVESAWRVHVLERWGQSQVGSIRRTEMAEWIAALTKTRSASITLRCHGIMKGIFEDAISDKRLHENPATKLKNLPKKPDTEHIYLDHVEVKALAEASEGRDLLIYLGCYPGPRWGELAGMRPKRINPQTRRIRIAENVVWNTGGFISKEPKGHENRTLEYPAFLDDLMADALKGKGPDDLLFTGADGGYLRHARTATGWFMRAVKRAGLDVAFRPHDMRHTAASLSVSAGANVKALQRMLGHKSAAMTLDQYADLFDSDLTLVAQKLDSARTAQISNVGKVWAGDDSEAA